MTSYDLHIHSCLSPCGDEDMTVNNIAGMAKIKNLRAVAITDHNTCKNCRPFERVCDHYGIVAVPGMEVTTAEEIHVLVYFRTVEDAEGFEQELDGYRMKIKNRIDLFGNQQILDEDDNIIGEYEYLLPAATMLSVDELYEKASKYGAAVVPAHIDKTSNGMIGILGMMPEAPVFGCVEIKDKSKTEKIKADGVTGFLCNRENVCLLVNAIEKLLNDKELRKQMGDKACCRYKERYTLEAFTKTLRDVLSDILN